MSLSQSVLSKLARIWRWFWSREELASGDVAPVTGSTSNTANLRHVLFGREHLEHGDTKPERPGRSLIRYVLSSENLLRVEPQPEPDNSSSGPRAGSLHRNICQGESQPAAGSPTLRQGTSFLRWIFSRESLPQTDTAMVVSDNQPNPES